MSSKIETVVSMPRSAEYSAGLQVVVCSLPRTGTTSIKLALERLGYRNVYHMSTFINHTEDYRYWDYVIRAKISGKHISRSVWDSLFRDYQAVVDAPGCYFSVELAEAYPDAKVVILGRDSEKWYNSFAQTVQEMIKRRESLEVLEWALRPCMPTQASAIIRMGNLLSRSGVGLGSYDKEECLKYFHRYYADCRSKIAPGRCIDYKVQDGWSPLCKHLGVCVPRYQTSNAWVELPFPRANDTEAFHFWVNQLQYTMLRQFWRNVILYGLVLFGTILLCMRLIHFSKLNGYTLDD
ncbi:hypothetical protein F5B22DRAFT_650791 [Xylaria bambusicola]|uniref:uncharacterized protein n=1 Tax=Xylaria bambusicola TaxID=326684 RepID=UPI00200824D4|nr:uncharacterized protein F5B22DRAFT_650791 [Xylaria bambusicola]KAI0506402.1 hypothetical protein F5B22DRAFT_650791 [Xylaria bambusicola]